MESGAKGIMPLASQMVAISADPRSKSRVRGSAERQALKTDQQNTFHFLGVAPLTCKVDTKSLSGSLPMLQIITQSLPF